jgi:hypothetical protein
MRAGVPWSDRRRRTLMGLGAATVVLAAASFLPDEAGVTALFLAALCGFLFVVAAIVFVVVPGPGTFGTLLRSTTLAAPALVVAVLLLLAAPDELRPLWVLATAASAAWVATALWLNRGAEPPEG